MDTSRIKINTIDNSSSSIENQTAVTGFTVVMAAKGPKTPIRVPSGASAMLKDVFGVSSKDYPEMFEVETFNREYDLWVSAPYREAKVPAAYVTKDGVFLGKDPIEYNDNVEKAVFGDEDGAIDLSPESVVELLHDIRYQKSNGAGAGDDLGASYYPTYEDFETGEPAEKKKAVVIDLGLAVGQIASSEPMSDATELAEGQDEAEAPKYRKYELLCEQLVVKGLSGSVPCGIALEAEDKAGVKLKQSEKEIGCLCTKDDNRKLVALGDDDVSDKEVYAVIYGAAELEAEVITEGYVHDSLDQESERQALSVFLVDTVKASDVYGMIIPKYPSERALHIDFNAFNELQGWSAKSATARNTIKMSVYEEGAFHDKTHPVTVIGSLDPAAKDANGAAIGFTDANSYYADQNLVYVHTFKTFSAGDAINRSVSKYPGIVLDGGVRSFAAPAAVQSDDSDTGSAEPVEAPADNGADMLSLHDLGWGFAADGDYSDVDVFFDSETHANASRTVWSKSKFFSLAGTDTDTHRLAGYIFNCTVSPGEIDALTGQDQLTFGRNYWNVCNEAIVNLSATGSKFVSPMTGAKALMQCRIIENRYGGVAPMWENSGSPGMGGQLNMVSVSKMRYKYTKSQLDRLDELNFNPIVNDRQYGIMCVGQKTCKDGDVTDWSYIGHASAFLNFIKQVRNNVMVPQIGKANNPYYRTLRKEQVEQYLARRLEGNNRIWAEGSVDTSTADGVNDAQAMKARKFVINVRVKVDVFSESVELNFTNEDQDTTISA